jgi:hypothetical protein
VNRLRRSGNAPSAAKAFDQWMQQVRRAEQLGMDVRKFIEQYEAKGHTADEIYKASFKARAAIDAYVRTKYQPQPTDDPWARTDRS